jgi:hypothetical protein
LLVWMRCAPSYSGIASRRVPSNLGASPFRVSIPSHLSLNTTLK